jgi:quercetin dioxygenase-like cupin family protein
MPAPSKKLCLNIALFCAVALLIACSGRSGAVDTMDAVTASPDKFKVLLENDHVRVIEYKLRPGEKDNWHTHPAKSSYVVSGGNLKIRLENGEEIDVEEKTGTATWMNELGKHHAENVGNTDVVIVFTEVKAAP